MAAFPISEGCPDLTGQQVNELTVTQWNYSKNGHRYWICECSCGNTKGVPEKGIVSARTRSCGCLQKKRAAEAMRAALTKHGATETPEYSCWYNMHTRCRCNSADTGGRYKARGISVCDRWSGEEGFSNFLSDMGKRPSSDHSIDRIDNNKGYSPDNCRWATAQEQANNTRRNRNVTAFGRTQSIAAWSRETGINQGTILTRLKLGWDEERAVSDKTDGRSLRWKKGKSTKE